MASALSEGFAARGMGRIRSSESDLGNAVFRSSEDEVILGPRDEISSRRGIDFFRCGMKEVKRLLQEPDSFVRRRRSSFSLNWMANKTRLLLQKRRCFDWRQDVHLY
jgi:hypothetical protein